MKGLLLLAKSKRGRELLLAVALGGLELARSKQARTMYATVANVGPYQRGWKTAGKAAQDLRLRLKRP